MSWRPRNNGIGSSNRRCQPRSATAGAIRDRLAQPLHGEFDILRLQMAPALDLGLVPPFQKALEIFRSQLLCGRALLGEFLSDERVPRHGHYQSAVRPGGQSICTETAARGHRMVEKVPQERFAKRRLWVLSGAPGDTGGPVR